MLTCNVTRKTDMGLAGDSSALSARSAPPPDRKKRGEVDSPKPNYRTQRPNDVFFSATQPERGRDGFFALTTGEGFVALAEHPPVMFRSPKSTSGAPRAVAIAEESSFLDESMLGASNNESVCSFVSEFARARRRRREQLTHEAQAEGEKQRQDLEQAFKSLEEMQRENKERMERVVTHTLGTRRHILGNNLSSGDSKSVDLFLRTRSAFNTALFEASKSSAFERAMTSIVMPESKGSCQSPLPLRHKTSELANCPFTPEVLRQNKSPTTLKNSGVLSHMCQPNYVNASKRKESQLRLATPPKSSELGEKSFSEKKEFSPCAGGSLVLKHNPLGKGESSELRSPINLWGERKPVASERPTPFDNTVSVEGRLQQLSLDDERKGAKERNFVSCTQKDGQKPSLSRTNGRSASPPIIILTVESRRNMNDEEARRLLSAEPIKRQDSHGRHAVVKPFKRSSNKEHSLNKHSPRKAETKSLFSKDLHTVNATVAAAAEIAIMASTTATATKSATKAATKSAVVMRVLRENAFSETKSSGGGGVSGAPAQSQSKKLRPGGPAAANKEPVVGDSSEAPDRNGVLSTRPTQSKTCDVMDSPLLPQEPKKNKTSAAASTVASTAAKPSSIASPAESRMGKGASKSSNIPVVAAPKGLKEKVSLSQGRRVCASGGGLPDEAAAGSNARRRKAAYSKRISVVHADDNNAINLKSLCRESKGRSPPQHDGRGGRMVKRNSWQNISLHEKDFSAFLRNDDLIERDVSLRPPATDRHPNSRVYTVKRFTNHEYYTAKQLAPFCTECGRRHLSDKVKFCAFCGHKREVLR